jgi:UDP-N-acetylbacillosamine N-acetyltransferase
MEKIYIYGANGHGTVVGDIAKAYGYQEVIFIDDGDNEFLTFDDVKMNNHIPIIIAIGCNKTRKILFEKLINYDFNITTLVHPSSVISPSAKLDKGIVIMPNVVINGHSKISRGVILNTSCVIEHDNIIEEFVHISPKVALAGNVIIKKNTHIGIGTSIIQGKTVNENCIVGANSTVITNIEANSLAYGTPCKRMKDVNE